MSWNDFYRRRDAINEVLATAERDHEAGLPYAGVPLAGEVFSSPEELALALQHKWSQALTGRIDNALIDAVRSQDADQIEAVTAAWRSTAAANPVLRRVLDDYAPQAGPVFAAAQRAEQRLLALAAGLADAAEPIDEITRVGSAFLNLIRNTPQPARRHRSPVEQLLRRLVASS